MGREAGKAFCLLLAPLTSMGNSRTKECLHCDHSVMGPMWTTQAHVLTLPLTVRVTSARSHAFSVFQTPCCKIRVDDTMYLSGCA